MVSINRILTAIFLALLALTLVVASCEKEPDPPAGTGSFLPGSAPAITVQAAQNLTYTGAEVNVQLTSTGNRVIKRLCLCYSTTKTEPDTTDQTVELGEVTATGTYKATLQNLNHNTKYYFRAYCRNLMGSSYSTGLDFTTPKDIRLPEVTTGNATSLTATGATLAGTITSFGQGSTSVTQHGHVWATHDNPTLSDQKTQLGSTSSTSFSSSITGLLTNTTYYVRAYATNSEGTSYGNQQTFTTLNEGDVYNPITGKIWMDRNLGANRAATSSTDAQAYGDLYQWGRGTDGHQIRTSGTTTTLSSSDTPGHGNFILAPNSPYDWRSPRNSNLWQGVNGTNNPCPAGYRLPTEAEWNAERLSWGSNNSSGAFASPLKLPVAGTRNYSNGSLNWVGSYGRYWSSTGEGTFPQRLAFNADGAGESLERPASGCSVRCIKDQ